MEQYILSIILIALVLTGGFTYLREHKVPDIKEYKVVTPFGKSINIFSFFKKSPVKPKKIIYGYLPYWALDKLSYIQLDKLTDIAYFGLYLNADGTFMTKLDDGTTEPGYNNWKSNEGLRKFISDAKANNIRFSLTVMSHNDEISDKFLECTECWSTMLSNLKTELKYQDIQNVNLNFEYAGETDPSKKEAYTKFVEFITTQIHNTYPNSYVVVATFADSVVKPRVTDIEALGKVTDGIFIMGYDFHRPDSDNAGPVAPIDGIGQQTQYDIRTMIKDYLSNIPPNKIILGVPYYGYNWLVEEDKDYAKRKAGSDETGFSQSQAYSDIMDTILELKPEIKWDDVGKTPYFSYISPETKEIREVYFDNEQSLDIKYKLIADNNLAGVGIWALGYDGGYQELWNLLHKNFIAK